MFVKNRTPFSVALPRGHFIDGVFVAAVVLTVAYRITPGGLAPWEGERVALPTDPPDTKDRALWSGASVTAAGTVRGPGRPPHTAPVELRVGAERRRLSVTGDRTWLKSGGKLVASRPAAWESMPLSWSLAYGGSVDVPPGPMGPSKLPFPGGAAAYPMNPGGKGFVLDEAAAEGAPLPNIERADEPVRSPLDRPVPAGFAPCPDLAALRMPRSIAADFWKDVETALPLRLRMMHPAPGDLIFSQLVPGVPVELLGVGTAPLRFEVPACPVAVHTRRGASRVSVPAAVRSVHIHADEAAALITFGHSFSFERSPSWVDVTEA